MAHKERGVKADINPGTLARAVSEATGQDFWRLYSSIRTWMDCKGESELPNDVLEIIHQYAKSKRDDIQNFIDTHFNSK